MNDDDDILKDTITISSGGYSSYDYDYSTSGIGTITLNSGTSTSSINMSNVYYTGAGATVGGVSGTGVSSYTIPNGTWGAVGTGTNYVSTTNNGSIHVQGDAHFDSDIKIKGRSLVDFIETLEKRLAILTPDPKKLEKYEALQKAYKHYKMLEALCEADEDESK